MQALGVDLETIKSIVGHADIDMTEHYLHVQEPIRQDAIDRFFKEFGGDSEGPDDGGSGARIIEISEWTNYTKSRSGQNSGQKSCAE